MTGLDEIATELAKRTLDRDREMFSVPLNDWDDLHPKSVEMRVMIARKTIDDLVELGVIGELTFGVATDIDHGRDDVDEVGDAVTAHVIAGRRNEIRANAGMTSRLTRVYARRQTEWWVQDDEGATG